MTPRQQFEALRRRLARIGESDDIPLDVLVAAFAFELSILLSVTDDDFWVTVVHDPEHITDAEFDAENAWTARLDALFRGYLS